MAIHGQCAVSKGHAYSHVKCLFGPIIERGALVGERRHQLPYIVRQENFVGSKIPAPEHSGVRVSVVHLYTSPRTAHCACP